MAFTCALITKYAYILPLVEPLFVGEFFFLFYWIVSLSTAWFPVLFFFAAGFKFPKLVVDRVSVSPLFLSGL